MIQLSELVKVSNFYGKNKDFVIAGGGNTSFKNEEFLWIKASGTSMDGITEDGFVKLKRDCLNKISLKQYSSDPLKRENEIKEELNLCIAEDKGKRPSVETSLHNLLDFKFIVHTHPTLVNALMCSINSRKETEKLFGDQALYIEYTDPGYVLFKMVEKKVKDYKSRFKKEPAIIFLENHGIFAGADSCGEIKEIYSEVETKINSKIAFPIPSATLMSHELSEQVNILSEKTGMMVKAFNSALIQEFVDDPNSFASVKTAFTPDNIVYCKAHYPFSDSLKTDLFKEFQQFETAFQYPPKIMAVKNKGIICIEDSEKSVNTVYEVFEDMLKIGFLSRNFGGSRCMTDQQIEFIDHWEVENYRRKIAKNGK